jgi:conjugal transfer pilus assembly protein TraV
VKGIKQLTFLACLIQLHGCSSFLGLGEEEFGCTGLPTGVKCLSALEVHKATDYKDYVSAEDIAYFNPPDQVREGQEYSTSGQNPNEPMRRRFGEQARSASVMSPYVPPHVRSATPMPDGSIPILTRPKILRIWIAPWEDDEGFLNTAGYTYKEVVPRQWAIGEPYRGQEFKQLKAIVQEKPAQQPDQNGRPNARPAPAGNRTQASSRGN